MAFRKRSPFGHDDFAKTIMSLYLPVTKNDLDDDKNGKWEKQSPLRRHVVRGVSYCGLFVIGIIVVFLMLPISWVIRAKIMVESIVARMEDLGYYDAIYGFDTTNYLSKYPSLKTLEDDFAVIKQELQDILQHTAVDKIPITADVAALKSKVWTGIAGWRSIWLKNGFFIPENEKLAPKTVALLKKIPNLYSAFFSFLEPGQHVPPHFGHWKGYIRYQLPLIVPANNEVNHKCYLRSVPHVPFNQELFDKFGNRDYSILDPEKNPNVIVHYFKEGQGFMFDDIWAHDVRNESNELRVTLFLDIARNLPWYLDILNKIILSVIIRSPHLADLRNRAVVGTERDISIVRRAS